MGISGGHFPAICQACITNMVTLTCFCPFFAYSLYFLIQLLFLSAHKDFFLFNSRRAIAAIIGDVVVFYNSKNLNFIGALSFLRSVHTFLIAAQR